MDSLEKDSLDPVCLIHCLVPIRTIFGIYNKCLVKEKKEGDGWMLSGWNLSEWIEYK